jgi:hypothetical protein
MRLGAFKSFDLAEAITSSDKKMKPRELQAAVPLNKD